MLTFASLYGAEAAGVPASSYKSPRRRVPPTPGRKRQLDYETFLRISAWSFEEGSAQVKR